MPSPRTAPRSAPCRRGAASGGGICPRKLWKSFWRCFPGIQPGDGSDLGRRRLRLGRPVCRPHGLGRVAALCGVFPRHPETVPDINAFIRAHETELEGINLRCHSREMELALRAAIRETLPELYMTSSFGGLVELANREAGKPAGCALWQGSWAWGRRPWPLSATRTTMWTCSAGRAWAWRWPTPPLCAWPRRTPSPPPTRDLGVAKFLHRICDARA